MEFPPQSRKLTESSCKEINFKVMQELNDIWHTTISLYRKWNYSSVDYWLLSLNSFKIVFWWLCQFFIESLDHCTSVEVSMCDECMLGDKNTGGVGFLCVSFFFSPSPGNKAKVSKDAIMTSVVSPCAGDKSKLHLCS